MGKRITKVVEKSHDFLLNLLHSFDNKFSNTGIQISEVLFINFCAQPIQILLHVQMDLYPNHPDTPCKCNI